MNIVIDATAAVSGGRHYLDKLIEHLVWSNSSHRFIIIHTGDLEHLNSKYSSNQISFYRFDLLGRIDLPLVPVGAWRMVWRKLFLPKLIERFDADLFFSNSGYAPPRNKRKYRVLIALHNSMPLREELIAEERSTLLRLRLVCLRRMIRRSLEECDAAIVFSNDTRKTIREKFAETEVDLRVIHHGIDQEWGGESTGLESLTTIPRGPYLLYVSQFHRYKNVIRLLEAFALVAARVPELSLVLVGEKADPLYWREIDSAIERTGIGERVIYLGSCPRDQLKKLYRGAMAFVHPSLAETCSFPLLEAMAIGLPIAAARMSALPEIGGEAAHYFDPYDVADIAKVLNHLIDREDVRQILSRKARDRAATFCWKRTTQQTIAVFEELLAGDRDQKQKNESPMAI